MMTTRIRNMNKYIPSPIDLSEVELPNDINSLVELIAKNVHDVWAKQRIEEGWALSENHPIKGKNSRAMCYCCSSKSKSAEIRSV